MGHRQPTMTRQRRVILEVLKNAAGHPTADEIYDRVRKRLPRISLATVYRNLEVLAEAGHTRKVEPEPGRMRFECRLEPHCHIRCLECGCVRDVEVANLPKAEDFAGSWGGFKVVGYCLQFMGICPACRRRGGEKRREGARTTGSHDE